MVIPCIVFYSNCIIDYVMYLFLFLKADSVEETIPTNV